MCTYCEENDGIVRGGKRETQGSRDKKVPAVPLPASAVAVGGSWVGGLRGRWCGGLRTPHF